jgi:hypothetical protein
VLGEESARQEAAVELRMAEQGARRPISDGPLGSIEERADL